MKVQPYHTVTPEKDDPGHRDVYHDLSGCPDGLRIKISNRRPGTAGRPGLDPGTLGLKEGCIWSDWSGGVGLVCGMECGICERTVQLGIALAHVRSRNETLKRSATSCAFANLECEPPRVCSPKFPTRFRFKSYKAN